MPAYFLTDKDGKITEVDQAEFEANQDKLRKGGTLAASTKSEIRTKAADSK